MELSPTKHKKYRKRTLLQKRELLRTFDALPQGMRNAWLTKQHLYRSLLRYWRQTLPKLEKRMVKKHKKDMKRARKLAAEQTA